MRKYLLLGLALAISLVPASAAWAGASGNTSMIDGVFDPSALPTNNFLGGSLNVEVGTIDEDDPGSFTQPTIFVTNATDRVQINFDDDFKFTTKGLDRCTKSLVGTTTEQALTKCRSSKVGTGSAVVCANNGVGGCVNVAGNYPQAVVTAFNGPRSNRKPTILLHSRVDFGSLHSTSILVGILKNAPDSAGPDFGKQLDVNNITDAIPPGTGIADFDVTVKRTYRVDGNRRRYVSARCHDGNKRLNFQGIFTYAAGSDTVLDNQVCT